MSTRFLLWHNHYWLACGLQIPKLITGYAQQRETVQSSTTLELKCCFTFIHCLSIDQMCGLQVGLRKDALFALYSESVRIYIWNLRQCGLHVLSHATNNTLQMVNHPQPHILANPLRASAHVEYFIRVLDIKTSSKEEEKFCWRSWCQVGSMTGIRQHKSCAGDTRRWTRVWCCIFWMKYQGLCKLAERSQNVIRYKWMLYVHRKIFPTMLLPPWKS